MLLPGRVRHMLWGTLWEGKERRHRRSLCHNTRYQCHRQHGRAVRSNKLPMRAPKIKRQCQVVPRRNNMCKNNLWPWVSGQGPRQDLHSTWRLPCAGNSISNEVLQQPCTMATASALAPGSSTVYLPISSASKSACMVSGKKPVGRRSMARSKVSGTYCTCSARRYPTCVGQKGGLSPGLPKVAGAGSGLGRGNAAVLATGGTRKGRRKPWQATWNWPTQWL